MNKEQLVKAISVETQLSQKEVIAILNAFTETIVETVAEGNKVTLVGFGTFEPRPRKERQGINPKTAILILKNRGAKVLYLLNRTKETLK